MAVEQYDLPAILAWWNPAGLIAALDRDISEMATVADRVKREREILSNILDLEHTEESIIMQNGAPRRPDIDPRAVLGVDGPPPSQE